MIESTRLWERIASELDEDIGFRKGGSTYVASNEAQLEARVRWLDKAREFNIDSVLLNSQQTDKLLDQDKMIFTGALVRQT